MNKIATEQKSIWAFAEYLRTKEISLAPVTVANEFLSFFSNQKPPISHYWIESFCSEIGIDEVQYESFPENMRGFHSITPESKITIVLEQSGYAGRVHTLYHEIYEIICEIAGKPNLKTESRANLFAASVIMPEHYFFEYVVRRGLMFSEIKIYYSEIATDSILLRINRFFRKRGLFYIAYLLRNINAYHRASAHEHKHMAEFKRCLAVLGKFDEAKSEDFTRRVLDESVERILQLPEDEFSLIKFSIQKKVVLAEPILLDWNGAIKEIAIQVLEDEVYNNLAMLLKEQ